MPATTPTPTRTDEETALLCLNSIIKRLEMREDELRTRYIEDGYLTTEETIEYRELPLRLSCYRNAAWYLEREPGVNV